MIPAIVLKKKEDRRIRAGHPWIYSNEIDVSVSPLKNFKAGELVQVVAHDQSILGLGYINPKSLIAVRILTEDSSQNIDTDFFVTRLVKARELREQLFPEPYYRLVFSEADLLPGVVIDRFGEHFVVQINTAGMEALTSFLLDAIKQVFPQLKSILLRNDSSIRLQEGLTCETKLGFGEPTDEVLLIENKIQFFAPLMSGQKTGWFYDHRMNRARLKVYVKHKRVLDVFSYLGGWGIAAAEYGATQVDCVDASEKACDYIRKNAAKNNLSDKVNVICDDAFDALKLFIQKNNRYDVIILDPPAFVKKAKDREAGLIAYQRINELALKLLNTNGVLITCSCSMHISMDDLQKILTRAAFRTQTKLQILEYGHQGPDHPIHPHIPESNYLKAIFARKL